MEPQAIDVEVESGNIDVEAPSLETFPTNEKPESQGAKYKQKYRTVKKMMIFWQGYH